MRRFIVVLVGLFLIGGTFLWQRGVERHVQLTQPPARGARDVTFPAVRSTIGAVAVVSLAKLGQEINTRVPTSFSSSGTGEDVCKQILNQNVCVGTQYDATLTRGQIAVSAVDSRVLRLTIPLGATGQGGLRGDLANLLDLDAKNFDAEATAAADLSLGLDDQGCPAVTVSVALLGPPRVRVEIVGGVWLDLAQTVIGAIDGAAADIQRAITVAVPCDLVKQQLAALYTTRHFLLALSDVPPAYINFTPAGLSFSGLILHDEQIRVAAAIDGTLEVESTPIDVHAVPLPPIAPIEATPPLMKLAVPLRVPYTDLGATAMRALADQRLAFASPAGEVRVRVFDVEFFPSGASLAVRVAFAADLPDQWLDVHGEAHLIATPRIKNGQMISLTDVMFTRVLDNDAWNALTVAFEPALRDAIADSARFDIAPSVAEASQRLEVALKQPISGMAIGLEDLRLGVGRLALADDAVSVEGLAEGRLTVALAP
jgi:hypothetical protein